MTYSCSDFTADLSGAFNIPDHIDGEDLSAQADICLAEIDRLQKSETNFVAALGAFVEMPDNPERDAAHMTGMRISFAELRQVKAVLAGVPVIPAAPAPVAPVTVWTCTTDGDNMPMDTTVGRSFEDVAEACRQTLALESRVEGMPLDTAEQISDAWQKAFDGACIIESHTLPAPATPAVDPCPGQDEQAEAEGWALFETDLAGTLEIQADHDSPIFCRDGVAYHDEAKAFVLAKAAEGSAYHIAALARLGTDWKPSL